jgi:hypothetical protein
VRWAGGEAPRRGGRGSVGGRGSTAPPLAPVLPQARVPVASLVGVATLVAGARRGRGLTHPTHAPRCRQRQPCLARRHPHCGRARPRLASQTTPPPCCARSPWMQKSTRRGWGRRGPLVPSQPLPRTRWRRGRWALGRMGAARGCRGRHQGPTAWRTAGCVQQPHPLPWTPAPAGAALGGAAAPAPPQSTQTGGGARQTQARPPTAAAAEETWALWGCRAETPAAWTHPTWPSPPAPRGACRRWAPASPQATRPPAAAPPSPPSPAGGKRWTPPPCRPPACQRCPSPGPSLSTRTRFCGGRGPRGSPSRPRRGD